MTYQHFCDLRFYEWKRWGWRCVVERKRAYITAFYRYINDMNTVDKHVVIDTKLLFRVFSVDFTAVLQKTKAKLCTCHQFEWIKPIRRQKAEWFTVWRTFDICCLRPVSRFTCTLVSWSQILCGKSPQHAALSFSKCSTASWNSWTCDPSCLIHFHWHVLPLQAKCLWCNFMYPVKN